MKRLVLLPALALALPLLLGCTYRSIFHTDDARRLPPIQPNAVRLSTALTPPPGAVIVGPVAVSTGSNSDEALAELARLAAEHGADLVVRLRLQQIQANFAVSGLAVRTVALAPAPPAPVAPPAPAPPAPAEPPQPVPAPAPPQEPSGTLDGAPKPVVGGADSVDH